MDDGCEPISPPPHPQRERWHRRHVRVRLLWLAGAGVAIAASWLGWKTFEGYQREVAGAQAVRAAKNYVLILSNINAATVDNNFSELYRTSTTAFNDAHSAQAAELRKQLIEKKVSANGSIEEVTVISSDTDKATVELLVNESVRNTDSPEPIHDRVRLSLDLEKTGGQWLTSGIRIL
jgi:Mce-associated membrane protein